MGHVREHRFGHLGFAGWDPISDADSLRELDAETERIPLDTDRLPRRCQSSTGCELHARRLIGDQALCLSHADQR